MLNSPSGGKPSQGWARLCSSSWAIAMCISCFVYCLLIITNIFLSFSVLLNCLYLNPGVLPVFLFSPISGGWSDQMALWCSAAWRLKHSKGISKFYVRKSILSNIQHEVGLLKSLWSCKRLIKQMSVVNILGHEIAGIHLAQFYLSKSIHHSVYPLGSFHSEWRQT